MGLYAEIDFKWKENIITRLALRKLIGGFPMTPLRAPGKEVQIRFQFPTSAVLYGAEGVGGPLLGPCIAA